MNFSPKANLRLPGTYSHTSQFTQGGFKEVIDDATIENAANVKKVLFCSGKVYYDLADRQQKDGVKDVAIIRLEQLYPLPAKQLEELYKKYNRATWFWVQEEPLNMGAAAFLQMHLKSINYGIIRGNQWRQQQVVIAKCMHKSRQRLWKLRSLFDVQICKYADVKMLNRIIE